MPWLQPRACSLLAELAVDTLQKILPKSSYLVSQGTFPWSVFVDSDILGMLNAPLPPQPLELDFQTLELYFQKILVLCKPRYIPQECIR